ncbi:type I methionyl aminopeptidase [Patescibacteria group bacterium]|nr:type I methionyl aminopeptidase [Patescibacteria group bacterium]
MNYTKTEEALHAMHEGGKALGTILQDLLGFARPGIRLSEIEDRGNAAILAAGGTPSFKTVRGYRWATCLCVNEAVVHGIPTGYSLAEGDLLTIDIGMLYKGYHTDTAWSELVLSDGKRSSPDNRNARFLNAGETALRNAIAAARAGNHIGHISEAIEKEITGAGYSIVKTLVGHGVGKTLHEAPQIPGFLRGPVEATPRLCPDMTIAIEVIYAMGKGEIVYDNDDGWTLATVDRSLSAVFEHTIAVTNAEPIILTKRGS